MRATHPENPRLEALLDRRDHLRVQISLLLDTERRDFKQLEALEQELAGVDRQISRHY